MKQIINSDALNCQGGENSHLIFVPKKKCMEVFLLGIDFLQSQGLSSNAYPINFIAGI